MTKYLPILALIFASCGEEYPDMPCPTTAWDFSGRIKCRGKPVCTETMDESVPKKVLFCTCKDGYKYWFEFGKSADSYGTPLYVTPCGTWTATMRWGKVCHLTLPACIE